jgi:putative transposase
MFDDKYYKGRYRIDSARLKGYDYSRNGMYFVTICTDEGRWFFGKVVGRRMVFNKVGQMADKYWREIPKHFDGVYLDEYVVMPNHVHGIIVIDRDIATDGGMAPDGGCRDADGGCRDADGDGTDETNWYLPSQKELMQAYINGAANNIPFPANGYWSSTEIYGNSSVAWFVILAYGYTTNGNKGNDSYARCVSR